MVSTASKSAFLAWYEPYHNRLVRYCSSRAFGVMSAEDLAQEAILATLANWNKIEDRSKLLSYMIGVVNNLVRNHRRRLPFQATLDERRQQELESKLGDAATATDIGYLIKAIDQLSDKQAEALRLFELSGFSIKEIAALQSTTEGAVKTRLSRARKELKQMLSEEGRHLTIGERLQIYATILL